MKRHVIARKVEVSIINQHINSNQAELIAIYGRRRVGKTYLIRTLFDQTKNYFEVVGKKDGNMFDQLDVFREAIEKKFKRQHFFKPFTSWKEAFHFLNLAIESIPQKEKIILFFDELPWLSTERSMLLQEFDHYWNAYWCKMSNVKIILCGSAASWMINNLINAKGGLHNRITRRLRIDPFNLLQVEEYIHYLKIKLNRSQILDLYMALGGIPYYLNELKKGETASQSIDRICFEKNGVLKNEFKQLFSSLFNNSELHEKIVKEIAKHRYGISRKDLLIKLELSSGGFFNEKINELEEAGFISSFVPYGKNTKDTYYRIIDEYCYFYLKWIFKANKGVLSIDAKNQWQKFTSSAAFQSWSGYSFEAICYKHINQITKKLKLEHIGHTSHTWNYRAKSKNEEGAQIDLFFEKSDQSIILCEIKFLRTNFDWQKIHHERLTRQTEIFSEKTKTKKQIFHALITPFAAKKNYYYGMDLDFEVNLDDLFTV